MKSPVLSLQTELGNLINLTVLNLHNNEVTGPIPPELGELTELVELTLNNNELTGPIPAELGNLTELTQSLNLHDNEAHRSYPCRIGQPHST